MTQPDVNVRTGLPVTELVKRALSYRLSQNADRHAAAMASKDWGNFYKIIPQKESIMFVTEAHYSSVLVHPEDPINVAVETRCTHKWNKHTLAVFASLKKLGVNVTKLLRIGSNFQPIYATKTLKRWAEHPERIAAALAIYELEPMKKVRPMFLAALDEDMRKTEQDAQLATVNGDVLLVGKSPDVGTGWEFPIDNRGNAAKNIRNKAAEIVDATRIFNETIKIAINAGMTTGTEGVLMSDFNGIKGSRDAADVVSAVDAVVDGEQMPFGEIVSLSATRKTGSTPGSFLHGKGTDDKAYRETRKQSTMTKYSLDPGEASTAAQIFDALPATMDPKGLRPGQKMIGSFDIGFQGQAPYFTDRMIIPDPKWTLGADTYVMAFVEFLVHNKMGKLVQIILMMESGWQLTAEWYRIMCAGFGAWAEMEGYTEQQFRYTNNGDDLQVMADPEVLAKFVAFWGQWLKAKGHFIMEGVKEGGDKVVYHGFFYVGTYAMRPENAPQELVTLVSPRPTKTTTMSDVRKWLQTKLADTDIAKRGYVLPGEQINVFVTEEEAKDVDAYWEKYAAFMHYHGPAEVFVQMIKDRGYIPARREAARIGGGSEWLLGDDESAASEELAYLDILEKPIERTPGPVTPVRASTQPEEDKSKVVAPEAAAAAMAQIKRASDFKLPEDAVLITGQPGTGKTTLRAKLPNAMDIDWFGFHAPKPGTDETAWIVQERPLLAALEGKSKPIVLGTCDNMYKDQEWVSHTSLREKAGLPDKTHTAKAISNWPWQKKILLWYDPTDAEYGRRFGASRDNDVGKDPVSWAKIKENLIAQKKSPPNGFVLLDTTGKTIDETVALVNTVLEGGTAAAAPAAPPAETGTPGTAGAAPAAAPETPLKTKVEGPHYHLPPDGKRVVTLAESGRTETQYIADKAASNPAYQTPGKDHADWPKDVPLPMEAVIYDETGTKGGKAGAKAAEP